MEISCNAGFQLNWSYIRFAQGAIHLVRVENFPKNQRFLRTCTYQDVRNVSFLENFAYVLIE